MEAIYPKHISINQWAESDRPRERMLQHGRRVLSDAELIAILIGSGSREESAVEVARKILNANQNSLHVLATQSVADLMKFKGIGVAKAIAIVAALEFGRRRSESAEVERPQITCSMDVYNVLRAQYEDLHHEEFWILLLNAANRVIGKHLISSGGRTGTVVDAKIVFETALGYRANAVILSHNHPSGNLEPSDQDKKLTCRLMEAGSYLNIQVLDHLIFANGGYYSFLDKGQM